jgi:hypothetical protein
MGGHSVTLRADYLESVGASTSHKPYGPVTGIEVNLLKQLSNFTVRL